MCTYDGHGRRADKKAEGKHTKYIYAGDMLIREERGDNNTLYFGDNLVAGDNANEGDGVRLDSLNTTILEYFYGQDGVAGIVYEGQKYHFRRNIQGDVTHIYTIDGILKVCYTYDAWGNHKVLDADGKVNTAPSFIGNVNPFRYRGYYFDRETGLYYCKSRYYDPEVGRWINADSIEYLDPETINGLNLYAYCGNNPVMRVDTSGHFWDWILDIGFLIWGVVDVIKNPTDWKNWASLGVDLVFAVIPFVPGGAGQVIKVGNKVDNFVDVASAINKIDNIHDLSKVTMIGRIRRYARNKQSRCRHTVNYTSRGVPRVD